MAVFVKLRNAKSPKKRDFSTEQQKSWLSAACLLSAVALKHKTLPQNLSHHSHRHHTPLMHHASTATRKHPLSLARHRHHQVHGKQASLAPVQPVPTSTLRHACDVTLERWLCDDSLQLPVRTAARAAIRIARRHRAVGGAPGPGLCLKACCFYLRVGAAPEAFRKTLTSAYPLQLLPV